VTHSDKTEAAISEHLTAVLRVLIELLRGCGEATKAEWLAERLAILVSGPTSHEARSTATTELHGIVLGMGGLMDMYLSAGSEEESKDANRELRRLADQLFELTR
jgi:hypothetical protein